MQVVRLRWYGERRREDPSQTIWAERKTHREPWTGRRSIKVVLCTHQRGLIILHITGDPNRS